MTGKDKTRTDNRATFPATAAILDMFRNEFGESVKLLYAVEGGQEIGKKPLAAKRFMTVGQWLNGSRLVDEAMVRLEEYMAKQAVRGGVK